MQRDDIGRAGLWGGQCAERSHVARVVVGVDQMGVHGQRGLDDTGLFCGDTRSWSSACIDALLAGACKVMMY